MLFDYQRRSPQNESGSFMTWLGAVSSPRDYEVKFALSNTEYEQAIDYLLRWNLNIVNIPSIQTLLITIEIIRKIFTLTNWNCKDIWNIKVSSTIYNKNWRRKFFEWLFFTQLSFLDFTFRQISWSSFSFEYLPEDNPFDPSDRSIYRSIEHSHHGDRGIYL